MLIDDKPVRSCVTPMSTIGKASVTTLEGLGAPGKLHALQKAFIEEQAVQCGYCIPGIIMSAKALLDANAKPTDGDIREALAGNLCRCGTHTRIVRAIQRAARELARAAPRAPLPTARHAAAFSSEAAYSRSVSRWFPPSTVARNKARARLACQAAWHANRMLGANYTRPFQSHGSIGPSCAVAHWKDGKLQVWSHSQGVFPLRGDLAKALRMAEADITVTHREGSGCYGHNGADDVALDAALVARATNGRPVKLQWMREDEFAWEPYGSAMAIRMQAALDETGRVVDWQHELWSHTQSTRPYDPDGCNLLAAWHLQAPLKPGPARNIAQPAGGSDRNAILLYSFARQKVINHLLLDMPVRVSALRTLGAYGNVFALESFIDELAAAAGADPLAFRLRHPTDPRARAVLEAAAARAGWLANAQRGLSAEGTGKLKRERGIGFAKYKNLAVYCAVVIDLEVDPGNGRVRVVKATSAADAGQIVNPDGFRNQIEGCIIQSASWTLLEAVNFDSTRMLTRTWTDYPILHFPEVPALDVTLIDRPEERSLGVGEGSQGPTAAAIANAFFNATGKRIRDLPLNPARVKAALA